MWLFTPRWFPAGCSPRGWTAWPRSAPGRWRWQSEPVPAPPVCGSLLPPGSCEEANRRRSHEHGRALIIFEGSAGTIGVITAANNWFVHGVKQDFSQTDWVVLFFFSSLACFIFSPGLMTGVFFTKKALICIWQSCLSYLMSSIPQSFRWCHQVSKFNGLPSCLNSPDIITIQMRERNTNGKGTRHFWEVLPSLKKKTQIVKLNAVCS